MARLRVLLPLLVLVMANAGLFGGVWWNRSGEPTGEIVFDQCHFGGPGGHSLQAEARYFTLQIASPSVSVDTAAADRGSDRRRERARDAVLLIEQGGPAFETLRARRAERRVTGSETEKFISPNRLVYADSADSASNLKALDPDAAGHAMMRGYVRSYDDGAGEVVSYRHASSLRIAIQSDYRALFKEIYKNRYPAGYAVSEEACTPEYRITLKFGAAFEPWISSVERF